MNLKYWACGVFLLSAQVFDIKVLAVIICAAVVMSSGNPPSGPGSQAPYHHGRCKPWRRQQLIRMLNIIGNEKVRQGGYNPRYMAFTWRQALRFPNLVTTTASSSTKNTCPAALQGLPPEAPKFPGSIVLTESCQLTDGYFVRSCPACPVFTDLGPDKLPRYINEVHCGADWQVCEGSAGVCTPTVMWQTFLRKTGRCHPLTGHEVLTKYEQSIRVCCECMKWPSGNWTCDWYGIKMRTSVAFCGVVSGWLASLVDVAQIRYNK